jgi:hypothetical protein
VLACRPQREVPIEARPCWQTEEALRHFRLVVASVLFLLASSAPALAQTAGPDQYVRGIQSLEDGIQDSTETAADGTQAVSEAL